MRIIVCIVLLAALVSCRQKMAEQSRLDTYGPAEAFEQNMEARQLPAGTIAFAPPAEDIQPEPFDETTMTRGRRDYESFCLPCHGQSGRGDGIVVRRGFPAPPSFLGERLREAPARHFYDVMTDGYGVMYSYRDRVPPADRWAIVAYVRALQYAQANAGAKAEAEAETGAAAGGGGQ